jgi:O-antigen ligase
MLSGAIQVVWVLLEVNEIEPYQLLTGMKQMKWVNGTWAELTGAKINGSYANTNPTAAMIAICAPAMLQWPLLILMAFGALWFLGSANGIATFIAGIFFYFAAIKLSKKLNILLLSSGIICPILAVPFLPRSGDFGASGRWEAWFAGIKAMSAGDWFTGKGLGWISSQFTEVYRPDGVLYFDKIHNEYLECLINLGAIGLILFIFLARDIFKHYAERPTLYAIFAASLVNSTLMFTYHISGIALIGIIAFTLLTNRE